MKSQSNSLKTLNDLPELDAYSCKIWPNELVCIVHLFQWESGLKVTSHTT